VHTYGRRKRGRATKEIRSWGGHVVVEREGFLPEGENITVRAAKGSEN